MVHKPEARTASDGRNSSAPKGMTHAELMKKLSANPRFVESKEPGKGFIILGAKASMTKERG